jgi:bifunctional UDP-N-acetylglucosamine pyrophosphorylase/glucosamine-1-phosphate N-acetyltransferase
MIQPSALAIVLAAGKGTRMKSQLPKVMHRLAGATLLAHVLRAAKGASIDRTAVVIAPGMEEVATAASALDSKLQTFVQAEQRGTADTVKAAREAFEDFQGHVLILYGDTPLLRPGTLVSVRGELEAGADLVVIGFEAEDPTGYGRLLLDDRGQLASICEEKDASAQERALTLCNSGIMAFRSSKTLLGLLGRIGHENAKDEFYLTDAVALARGDRLETRMVLSDQEEVLGVNSRAELAHAEAAMQRRLRALVMANGATLTAPGTVFLSHDTRIGKDVVIEPNVVIGERVVIEDGATIRGFCHIEGAKIGPGAIVGPFARLRPGASLAKDAHVGNFVEIKQAEIAEGAKVNHLTYIGDASVGARANVGAGTITCNYDGFAKHRTEIGAGAFIGSNSSLVAPVKIGEGAYIGSGSVISKDVAADALALTRAPQEERKGWAARARERRNRGKPKNDGNKGT